MDRWRKKIEVRGRGEDSNGVFGANVVFDSWASCKTVGQSPVCCPEFVWNYPESTESILLGFVSLWVPLDCRYGIKCVFRTKKSKFVSGSSEK